MHPKLRRVPGPTEHVIVIGAGLGGLSAALRLLGAGRRVTLLERSTQPGGRAGVIHRDGYAFDSGPTVLTMPDLIDDALSCVGESLSDRLALSRLEPAYRANFADGSVIDLHTDPDRMAQEIRDTVSARDAAGYLDLVRFLHRLYAVEFENFIDRNLDSPLALINGPSARLLAMGGLRRLAPKIGTYLTDERLRRLFSFQAMYAGLAPRDALAIYAVISYMDTVAGVFFPHGGMHAVSRALAGAAADHGADVRYGTEATRIEVSNGRAVAVHTADGERIPADAIVVNADLPTACRQLLEPDHRPRRLDRLRYSPSCVLVHAGSAREYPQLAHHNIFFGQAWQSTFDEIIDQGVVMRDPSYLVTTPTRTDPTLAPPGRHSYYVLFPTPNTRAAIDWSTRGEPYVEQMLAVLDQRGLPGFADSVETRVAVTPADWEEQGLEAGAPFAAAHTLPQSGPFRIPTLSRRVENLVFCGSNTQPGVGVPMVLISGKLAAERITGHRDRRRHTP